MKPNLVSRLCPAAARVLFLVASAALCSTTSAVELRVIYPEQEPELGGKEVDWIYGDYFVQNDQLAMIIAAPVPTRDANLTIRDVGGSILDLTLQEASNDQLGAYLPTSGRFLFQDPSLVQVQHGENQVTWTCRSSKSLLKQDLTSDSVHTATISYQLVDGDSYVTCTVKISGPDADQLEAFDGVRADRTFKFSDRLGVAHCEDRFFRQTLGFQSTLGDSPLRWKSERPQRLIYQDEHVNRAEGTLSWTVKIYPATSPLDLLEAIKPSENRAAMRTVQVKSNQGDFEGQSVLRGTLTWTHLEDGSSVKNQVVQTDDLGRSSLRLARGEWKVSASMVGFPKTEFVVKVDAESEPIELMLTGFSGFTAEVRDEHHALIPVKATLYAIEAENPDFGPDSTRTFVKNTVYSVDGRFRCGLEPGKYDVFFSHGPEHDMDQQTIEITAGQTKALSVQLNRVVDTTGWVSTELHSHSSPSGDNTSDQYGRVENLLCEHLEFAPCTEHNRISTYAPHLEVMGRTDAMATCTGMELTGRPLPVNHQNVFPLHHHPHTQNGGGPRTDANPEVQIERIAMWDEGADKVVQMNHPNLHQIYGDLDVDGKPDDGFRKMLRWTDVVEVHPLQTIFEDVTSKPPNVREMRIPLFQWLQLLNQGYRIPGVVNTDAHYNHHGSGWLRNWCASSTDDPAQISTAEMVEQAEAGHMIMSTGPFLSVKADSRISQATAGPGDDLSTDDNAIQMHVRVQCPNWLDVNRVQVFVNGKPDPKLNWTRKSMPDAFGDSKAVVKFDRSFKIELDADAHLIVATIGEGMSMARIMGSGAGNRPPIAVANPIFVDVDGDGFQPNGDGLGLPLPGKH